jgi:uncharacterized membrane protein YhaH (DUF805 family)
MNPPLRGSVEDMFQQQRRGRMSTPNYPQFPANQYPQTPGAYPYPQGYYPGQPYPPPYAVQPPPWSFGNVMFSFNGRINRGKWWAAMGITTGIGITAIIIGALLGAVGGGRNGPLAGLVVAYLLFLPVAMWIGLAAGTKRLHDCDKSGHWLWVLYVLPLVIGLIGNAISYGGQGGFRNPNPVGALLSLLAMPFWIWNFVQIGCLRGTRGPNQYGPDPIPHIP